MAISSATPDEVSALRAEVAALRAELAELRAAFTFQDGRAASLSVDRLRCLSIDFEAHDQPGKKFGMIHTHEQGCMVAFWPHGTNGAQFFVMTGHEDGEPRLQVTDTKGSVRLFGGGLEMNPAGSEANTAVLTGVHGGHLLLADARGRTSSVLGTMPWGGELVVNFHGNDSFPNPMQAGVLTRAGRMHFSVAPEVAADDMDNRLVYLGAHPGGGGVLNLELPGATQGVHLVVEPQGACVQVDGPDAPRVAQLSAGSDRSGYLLIANELGVPALSLGVLDDGGCLTAMWAGQERVRLHGTEHSGIALTFDASGYPNATLPPDVDTDPAG